MRHTAPASTRTAYASLLDALHETTKAAHPAAMWQQVQPCHMQCDSGTGVMHHAHGSTIAGCSSCTGRVATFGRAVRRMPVGRSYVRAAKRNSGPAAHFGGLYSTAVVPATVEWVVSSNVHGWKRKQMAVEALLACRATERTNAEHANTEHCNFLRTLSGSQNQHGSDYHR